MSKNHPLRQEFDRIIRKRYFKEHKQICARCGTFKGINLHHKIALGDGGTNDYENLIPLCRICHFEWHEIEGFISFEEYMELPNIIEIIHLLENNPIVKFENVDIDGTKTIKEISIRELFRYSRAKTKPMLEYIYDTVETKK